jgi:hypothetical protein
MDVIAVFLKPWMLATPIFVVAWLVVQKLADFGRVGDVLSLVVVGPGAVLASLVAAHWFDEDMRAIIDKVFSALRARLRRRTS